MNLFPALSGFKQGHLVVASTVSVHGNVPGGVFSAGTPCGSSRPYDATKLKVEELAQRMWQGQLTTCWRGCLDPPAGGGIAIHSASSSFNNVVHVQDAANFMALLLEGNQVGHQAAPIVSAEPIEMHSVVRAVTERTQSASRVTEIDEVVTEPGPFYICDFEARNTLGYTSRTTMEAVTRFIDESVSPGVRAD